MPIKTSVRRIIVVVLDLLVVLAGYALAFGLRFDFHLSAPEFSLLLPNLPFILAAYFSCFVLFSLYRGLYHFSSFPDLIRITKAVASAAFISAAAILFIRQGRFPRSVLMMQPILTYLGIGGIRFGIRLLKNHLNMPGSYGAGARRALIVGAGELGESLVRQLLKSSDPRYKVVGFIDDDRATWGMRLHGCTVFGGCAKLRSVLERQKVDEIIIATDARRGEVVSRIVDSLRDLEEKPDIRVAPGLAEMLRSAFSEKALRKVRPADLLNREVIRLDNSRITRTLAGKTVVVTGAGGTIGSELCRQVLAYRPAKLILVESHATSLFSIDAELRRRPGETELVSVLGDVRDQALVERLFNEHAPQHVLHAAAHKHVHQLETNVREGIANNLLGTYYVAAAAAKHGAETFLLVSTDKAVKPSSVMGATKRAAEIIVRDFARSSPKTRFLAVRFGNVLGSSGSVMQIFQEQIARGGPVTVTHPRATRFFMTVEEAVQLILQAASISRGGEIFILKMGTPVNILEMAKNMILLSGLEPDKDVAIQISGLKQGEKLDEELVEDAGSCDPSEHPSILILRPDGAAHGDLRAAIIDFEIAMRTSGAAALVAKLRALVPTFAPAAAHSVEPA